MTPEHSHQIEEVSMAKSRRFFRAAASLSVLALTLGTTPVFAHGGGSSGGSSGGGFLHHGLGGGSSGGGFLHHGGGSSGGGFLHHGGGSSGGSY